MRKYRVISARRGALPTAPLNALPPGQPRGGMVAQDFADDEDAAYAMCLENIRGGCTVTVTTPSGEEWPHEHIVSALRKRGSL